VDAHIGSPPTFFPKDRAAERPVPYTARWPDWSNRQQAVPNRRSPGNGARQ